MERFLYRREPRAEAAVRTVRETTAAQFTAGAASLTDHETFGVIRPRALGDINELPQSCRRIDNSETRLRLGALVRMAEAEEHPAVRARFPLIQQTLALAASRQLRNMATLGGNVLQRTRCEYFRGRGFACNKRAPGSGCAALEGMNRAHAVLGTSDKCIAAYAGDFAQALVALDATVETAGGRRFPFTELHRLPGESPNLETTLSPGERIAYIDVPAGPWTLRSRFVRVGDCDSDQSALVSTAIAMHLEGSVVREVRIALGGVATVPWRALDAEQLLRGRRLDEATATHAAEAAFADSQARRHNAFKIPLGKRTLVRALLETQAMSVAHE